MPHYSAELWALDTSLSHIQHSGYTLHFSREFPQAYLWKVSKMAVSAMQMKRSKTCSSSISERVRACVCVLSAPMCARGSRSKILQLDGLATLNPPRTHSQGAMKPNPLQVLFLHFLIFNITHLKVLGESWIVIIVYLLVR